MTYIWRYNWQAELFYITMNYITYFSVILSWFTIFNSFHYSIMCSLNQLPWTLTHIPNTICFIQIGMEPIFEAAYININDITILQWPRIGNTMTNNFINGSTATPWKPIIIEWRWISTVRNQIIINNLVDLLSCDTNANFRVCCI